MGPWLRGQSHRPVGPLFLVSLTLPITGKDVGSTLLALFLAELQSGQREKWDILSAPSQPGWWLVSQEGGWGRPMQDVIWMQSERVGALEGCGCD